MGLLVCISNVPDITTKVTFTNNNTQFNTAAVQFILNFYDEIALSRALELVENQKEGITVLHVNEASTKPNIHKELASESVDFDNGFSAAVLDGSTCFQSKQLWYRWAYNESIAKVNSIN